MNNVCISELGKKKFRCKFCNFFFNWIFNDIYVYSYI